MQIKHGFGHNVPAREPLWLWGSRKLRLPDWFTECLPARYTTGTPFASDLPVRTQGDESKLFLRRGRQQVNQVFQGMARMPVELPALVEARQRLRRELRSRLTDDHRQFLLGLVRDEPPWEAMRCRHLSELPAIRWKLQNLAKLERSSPDKHERQTQASS